MSFFTADKVQINEFESTELMTDFENQELFFCKDVCQRNFVWNIQK